MYKCVFVCDFAHSSSISLTLPPSLPFPLCPSLFFCQAAAALAQHTRSKGTPSA